MILRYLAIGFIEIALVVALYVIRGFHPAYLALLVLGLVLIILGLIRK